MRKQPHRPQLIELDIEKFIGDLGQVRDNIAELIEQYGPGCQLEIETEDQGFYGPVWVVRATLTVRGQELN